MQQRSLGALQVWDKRAQAQVLQVAPFLPRRPRSVAASAQQMAAEMERVQVLPVTQCLMCFWHAQHVHWSPEHSAAARCQHTKDTMQQGLWVLLQGALQDLRARLYWGFNEVLTPDVQKLSAACAKPGASLHAPATLLPTTPRISALLKVPPTLLLGAVARRSAMQLRNICVGRATQWSASASKALLIGRRCCKM